METATDTQPQSKTSTVEVQVRREERFACGCTTTRLSQARVARKWLLKCSGHGGQLVSVVTSMDYAHDKRKKRGAKPTKTTTTTTVTTPTKATTR